MPQLDLTTFFSQFFWFCIAFSTFYVLLLHYVMPAISLNLKFRKKKLHFLATGINKEKSRVSSLSSLYDKVLLKTLYSSRFCLYNAFDYANSLSQKAVLALNSGHFVDSNICNVKFIILRSLCLALIDLKGRNKSKPLKKVRHKRIKRALMLSAKAKTKNKKR